MLTFNVVFSLVHYYVCKKNVLNKPEEQNQVCSGSALAEKGRMKSNLFFQQIE